MSRRDSDFSNVVLTSLSSRVGLRCSNPECRKLTAGPHTEETRSVNIGVGAHLSAASPGGARFDPNLTADQRKSIENGIWLCQNCAKLVDSDNPRFTMALLVAWKSTAEDAARREIEGVSTQSAEAGTNVNSYYQSGGITAHTVNLHRVPDRVLDFDAASQILAAFRDRTRVVRIEAVQGDQETLRFADAIAELLRKNGVNVIGDPAIAVVAPNAKPLELFTGGAEYVLRVGPRIGA